MLERILRFSLRHRGLVVLGTLAIGLVGVFSLLQLPIDAVPDITNVQVQVLTNVSLNDWPVESVPTRLRPISGSLTGRINSMSCSLVSSLVADIRCPS